MFLHRIGCFFLLTGAGLLGLFAASDYSQHADYNYLLWAGVLIILGYGLWRRFKPRREPARRFRVLRRRGSSQAEQPPGEEP